MGGIVHFAIVAGATIASIQVALKLLDVMNVDLEPGFGVDDVIEGVIVALGVTVTMSLVRSIGRRA